MTYFIWSKMQAESGLPLPQILVLKEAERLAGDGVFWWGVGSALNLDVIRKAAEEAGGALPVLFSLMLSRPKQNDAYPDQIDVWTQWEREGKAQDLPAHVLEFSRHHGRSVHYALVCQSAVPLTLTSYAFDPKRCENPSGKRVGAQQVTALLIGDLDADHSPGVYHFGFRATLVKPWFVKLLSPRTSNSTDFQLFNGWKAEWQNFAMRQKRSTPGN